MTTINQKLGKKIKTLRKQARLSQEELAFQTMTDYSYLNQIEAGKKNPSIKRVAEIAKKLGISLSKLFDF
jgi:transcriptional regulator with XRE-family HTH domain